MKMPKMNWGFAGCIVCAILGAIFEEIERQQDTAETKEELKAYIDKKMAGQNPDEEDD